MEYAIKQCFKWLSVRRLSYDDICLFISQALMAGFLECLPQAGPRDLAYGLSRAIRRTYVVRQGYPAGNTLIILSASRSWGPKRPGMDSCMHGKLRKCRESNGDSYV